MSRGTRRAALLFRSAHRSAVAASANDWIMDNDIRIPCIRQVFVSNRAAGEATEVRYELQAGESRTATEGRDTTPARRFAELFVRPNKIVASIRILTQTVTLIQEPGDLKPFAQPLIVVLDLNVSNMNVYRFKVYSIACF